jgi:hypothetical protein
MVVIDIPKTRSEAISCVAYDRDSLCLYITFRGDRSRYRYSPVNERDFDSLLAASSMGAHYTKYFRHNSRYSKVMIQKGNKYLKYYE